MDDWKVCNSDQAEILEVSLEQVPIAKEVSIGNKFSFQYLTGNVIHKHNHSSF